MSSSTFLMQTLASFIGSLASTPPAQEPPAYPSGAIFSKEWKDCSVDGHGLPMEASATVSGENVAVSPGLVIMDAGNRFIVSGALPKKIPKAKCLFDQGGRLSRIKIQRDDEKK